jgi:hypothetical protein
MPCPGRGVLIVIRGASIATYASNTPMPETLEVGDAMPGWHEDRQLGGGGPGAEYIPPHIARSVELLVRCTKLKHLFMS